MIYFGKCYRYWGEIRVYDSLLVYDIPTPLNWETLAPDYTTQIDWICWLRVDEHHERTGSLVL